MVMIEMVECLFCIHPNKFFVCVIVQAFFFSSSSFSFFLSLFLFFDQTRYFMRSLG